MRRLAYAARAFTMALRFSGPETFTVGNSFVVRCALSPRDVVIVSPGADENVIGLQAINAGLEAPAVILLTPETGRVLAAAILNAADDADGTARLNFVPVSPDAPEPPQRAGAAS